MPLVVLTRGNPASAEGVFPPGLSAEELDVVWYQLQRQLAQLVPGARQIIAANSGHYIQLDRPQLVIDATRAVVDAVRNGETRLGPAELADTGIRSWLLVAIASTLTALGLALRAIACITEPSRAGGARADRSGRVRQLAVHPIVIRAPCRPPHGRPGAG